MTGEMVWIKQDGTDSNGDEWATHAAIANALGGELRPFDVYQGPYITFEGVGRVWLCADDAWEGYAYAERYDTQSEHFLMWDQEDAITCVRLLLETVREG